MGNKQRYKRTILCMLIFGFLAICVTGFMQYKEYKEYNRNYYNKINAIAELIKEKHPDVTDNEIMEILNSDCHDSSYDMLSKYGISAESGSVFPENDKSFKTNVVLQLIFACLVVAAFVLGFCIYEAKKRKEIAEIVSYVEQINKKNYELTIDNNTEDDLSILKNEVYKTMIMLREAADNSAKDKANLKESLSDISHQLKTPITSLKINLENLEDNPDLDEATRSKFIRNAMREVNNISFLVQYILKLSRLDANTIIYNNKPTLLSDIIKDSVEKVEALAELKEVELKVDSKEDRSLELDEYWQTEAVGNILKNAIEHAESLVTLKTEVTEVYSSITIENDGPVISEKDMKHVFERFYKGENSDRDSVGIGLALSKGVIEQSGGYVTVDNCDGKATRFVIKYLY